MTQPVPPFGPPQDSSGLPFQPGLPPLPPGGIPGSESLPPKGIHDTLVPQHHRPPRFPPGVDSDYGLDHVPHGRQSSEDVQPVNRQAVKNRSLFSRMPVMDQGLALSIKRYILLELGYPNIEVELCDEQMEVAIGDTIDDFLRYNIMNMTKFWRIPLQNAVVEYDLPSDIRNVREIVTFKLSQFDAIFGADLIINPIYLRNTRDAYQDILTFWLSEAAFETQKRTYGLETSWQVIKGMKKIRLYPTPASDRVAIIRGTYYPEPGEIDDQALGTKSELFRRCALARSMIILGRIRGKRPAGWASSQGNVILDGDQMKAEGAEMLKEGRDDVTRSGVPMGFYAG